MRKSDTATSLLPSASAHFAASYPLFWRLCGLLSVVVLAAGLMVLSSLALRGGVNRSLNSIDVELQSPALGTAAGAVKPQRDLTEMQAARDEISVHQHLALAIELACLAIVLTAAAAAGVQAWNSLVRRADRALALLPSDTARLRGDEISRLTQALIALSAGRAGGEARAVLQNRFTAESTRRNAFALDRLQEVAALLVEAPPSEFILLKALHVLTSGLGVETAGLRLSPATRASLRCKPLIASHGVPVALTDDVSVASAGMATVQVLETAAGQRVRCLSVPLRHGDETIALLAVEAPESFEFDEAQLRLTQTTAMLMTLALAGLSRGQEERRGALLEERAAIARELHDSLAQSLAFLKIQVARLQAILREAPIQGPAATQTAAQLRDGVSSAYRQVKELIAAFRVRMGTHGLGPALEEAMEEFRLRSELVIALDNRLGECRLTVNEEFHVLQVVREALSNTVRHARAAHVWVSLHGAPGGPITAAVEDDGKGFEAIADELSHYGLSIMRERASSLSGELTISARAEGGTRVSLNFIPTSAAPERATGAF